VIARVGARGTARTWSKRGYATRHNVFVEAARQLEEELGSIGVHAADTPHEGHCDRQES